MRKTFKTIVATLLIGSASLAFAAQANAAPADQQATPSQQELGWMERASKNYDGGGN